MTTRTVTSLYALVFQLTAALFLLFAAAPGPSWRLSGYAKPEHTHAEGKDGYDEDDMTGDFAAIRLDRVGVLRRL